MNIILYSNHCPCCEVLEDELKKTGLTYETVSDVQQMLCMGLTHMPMLSVDGNMMNYPAALTWLKERTISHED